MNEILKISDLDYYYDDGQDKRYIFKHVNYTFHKSTFYSIIGESGSGKTTLLMLLAGLDEPKKGAIFFNNQNIKDIGYDQYHKKDVQIIFQNYNLLNYLNAYDNILMALSITSPKQKVNKDTLNEFLNRFGINEIEAKRKVNQLSGGQQQRVAIARAVACNSEIILADEPTGNLDSDTSIGIINLFRELVSEYKKTVIMVTHNKELAKKSDQIIGIDQKNKNIYDEILY